MNAIDGMLNMVSGFLEKVTKWIPSFDVPWSKMTESWDHISPYISTANIIFPMSDLLIILGLVISFYGILIILWGIKFLKSMIPFL